MPAENVTFYAQWEPDPIVPPVFYTITYAGNGNTGGSVPVDSQEYLEGETVVIQDPGDLVRSGHNFIGWNTESDGSGTWYQSGDAFTMPAENVAFYAQWQPVGSGGTGTVSRTTPSAYYMVTYDGNDNTGGSVPVDNRRYRPGEIVVIQDQGDLARSGYSFIGWNRESDGSGTWYQPGDRFTMPAENVTFYAQWEPDGPTVREFFVDEHIWYIRGYENTEMRPNNNVTRAEVAMIFYRLLRPEMKDFTPNISFVDVIGDEWFGLGVGILVHHGIFTGYENGEFRPHSSITRRELAAVVSRFDQLLETNENPYRDVSSDDWAYNYILSATKKGWFVGYNGLFRPEANLTRAELVTAVNRILNRHILLEDIPVDVFNFPDLDPTHWAYTAFIEAAHTHEFERNEDGITEIWTAILGTGLDAGYNQ